ncbi:MAG TPA: NlpC/P60 family protein [Gaiellaceae bacterium]|nr:NlpC/P60 family protein [Gaiellaceae bacterium]
MKRLVPLLGVVLALALSSTAAADMFSVVHQHPRSRGAATFGPTGRVVAFTPAQSAPISFAALQSIWQAAGSRFGIPWEVLAAINKVETNFGQNLGPSSAGAIGWMQFMPSTWARWGMDANGDGVADPDNPTDAIFSAARYLAGCGGQFDITQAVYCYNHSHRYVSEVLTLAARFSRAGALGLFTQYQLQPELQPQLQPQIDSARSRVTASKSQLAAARAKAERLGRSVRRLLHLADTAPLLSDRLAARKDAVLMAVRRDTAEARARRLQHLLDAASTRLGRLRNELTNPTLAAGLVPPGAGGGVASIALQYLGVPYLWGGATPSGFDCSGLVQYVFAQIGISLPHNTVAQWHSPDAVPVAQDQLQPGDLVFFNKLDHVGIYLGNGLLVDAPHTGSYVRIDSLTGWYAANYDGARRIVGAAPDGLPGAGGALSFTSGGGGGGAFTSAVVYFTH